MTRMVAANPFQSKNNTNKHMRIELILEQIYLSALRVRGYCLLEP